MGDGNISEGGDRQLLREGGGQQLFRVGDGEGGTWWVGESGGFSVSHKM